MEMFGKEAVHGNPAYPTQWALNPSAYQNVDSNSVDWAALAQQWIAMKDAATVLAAPPPPPSSKADAEEGEAPMEVEGNEGPAPSPGGEWNATTNSWDGGNNWNSWGWGWGSGVDPKSDPSMMEGYGADGAAPMPGYTTGQGPTFQHGYWTAPQPENRDLNRRDRRSKSKNTDRQSRTRPPRDKPLMPPMEDPTPSNATIDAAKRRQLPAWIREGKVDVEQGRQYWRRGSRLEAATWALTLAASLTLGVEAALVLGALLSLGGLLHKLGRSKHQPTLHKSVLGPVVVVHAPPGLVYVNASRWVSDVIAAIADSQPAVLGVECSALATLDDAAAQELEMLIKQLNGDGTRVVAFNARPLVQSRLRAVPGVCSSAVCARSLPAALEQLAAPLVAQPAALEQLAAPLVAQPAALEQLAAPLVAQPAAVGDDNVPLITLTTQHEDKEP